MLLAVGSAALDSARLLVLIALVVAMLLLLPVASFPVLLLLGQALRELHAELLVVVRRAE